MIHLCKFRPNIMKKCMCLGRTDTNISAGQLFHFYSKFHQMFFFSHPSKRISCVSSSLETKGQVIQATFSFNLSRNIVALKLDELLPILPPHAQLSTHKFQCCKLQQYVV